MKVTPEVRVMFIVWLSFLQLKPSLCETMSTKFLRQLKGGKGKGGSKVTFTKGKGKGKDLPYCDDFAPSTVPSASPSLSPTISVAPSTSKGKGKKGKGGKSKKGKGGKSKKGKGGKGKQKCRERTLSPSASPSTFSDVYIPPSSSASPSAFSDVSIPPSSSPSDEATAAIPGQGIFIGASKVNSNLNLIDEQQFESSSHASCVYNNKVRHYILIKFSG